MKNALMTGTDTARDGGRFVGIASQTNCMDRGGDLILRGAFQDSLKGFLERGFIAFSHLWDALPIGYPIAAHDGVHGLKVVAGFHQDGFSQSVRGMMQERLERELVCGLSVGFLVGANGSNTFPNGKEMARYLARDFSDARIDLEAIGRYPSPCRVISHVAELFEVSIAMVPMNVNSLITFIE